MTALRKLIALLPIALAVTGSNAQFVRGNEAVKATSDGTKKVETPPITVPASKTKPCGADSGCHAGSWHMVETAAGLQECTEAYARPGTCRASSYGSVKRSRLWVVKSSNNWLQCQYPDLGSKCVNMLARPPSNLPFDAVQ